MEIPKPTKLELVLKLEQLQRLQNEGQCVGQECEETWDKLVETVESEDREKLAKVREELEVIIGC